MRAPTSQDRNCHGQPLLHGLEVDYVSGFLGAQVADVLFGVLLQLPWNQETLTIFGRQHPAPRLTAWFGDEGVVYRYSGADHRANPWTRELRALRRQLEYRLGSRFNFVLANYYRDGNDSMGWHADDEHVLGPEPVIASVSLGGTRRLRFKRRNGDTKVAIDLEHGSLLVMRGHSQRDWQHALPRSKTRTGERINLTFREVIGR